MIVVERLANEFSVKTQQVNAVVQLLGEGATVPFIARYRKEATGGLSDTQLRDIVERLQYLTELEERRTTILSSITKQEKLTPELETLIQNAVDKTTLEDLYLPYKPKRRTKAQIARENGLEPLALDLLNIQDLNPESEAEKYINSEKDIHDVKSALDGARQILMEMFSENADLLGRLRDYFWRQGKVFSQVLPDKETVGAKFSDYFDFNEKISDIPSHRLLALLRGRKEEILNVSLAFPEDKDAAYCYNLIAKQFNISNQQAQAYAWLWQVVEWTWKIKLHTKLELELLNTLRDNAEQEAINVFKNNLKNLLMTSPAGKKVVMGLDPGLRTGVKLVVVDDTGKLLEETTIYPHQPRQQWEQSIAIIAALSKKHQVELISVGNGTASRETDQLAGEVIQRFPELKLSKVMVSEAGASVYSASELAAKEFPNLDVSLRGAVSIARRLQDPLAELVKIDPQSIGVGQYQHDVNQAKLGKSLAAVVEDCVNAVGTDINTASVPLLASISGLNEGIAKNIVEYREQHGRFKNRNDIKKVPRLGDKTYEQCVGFLRIIDGNNPLDCSAVHPESYPLVDQILNKLGKPIQEVMGNVTVISAISPQQFISEGIGLPTVQDILNELKKPGRDPRPEFKVAQFKDGVESIGDLKPGMALEGVITNVANFGAFVDIGVHQDGLVHISEVADHFVADIHQVVKVGQIVTVKVMEVDLKRKRISLSMKTKEAGSRPQQQPKAKKMSSISLQSEDSGMSLLATKLREAMK